MVNDIVLEVIVVKTWKYADDKLFHLAFNLGHHSMYLRDATDFVPIRVNHGNLEAPATTEKCGYVRVHGFYRARNMRKVSR